MAVDKMILYLVSRACLLQTDALLKTDFDIKPGFRSDSATLETVSARSQIECAAVCAREPLCSAYNYHCAARDQSDLLCGGGNDTQQAGWTVGYEQESVGRNH